MTKSEEIKFNVAYGEYLSQINNHEKLYQLRQKINPTASLSSKLLKCSAKRLEATIDFCDGKVKNALESTLQNYKDLCKLLKCVEQDIEDNFEVDDCLRETYANLRMISEIYRQQGLPLACSYYLQQGKELAKKTKSRYFQSQFAIELTGLKRHVNDTKDVQVLMQDLENLTLGVSAKQKALYQITAGDLTMDAKDLTAETKYERAIEVIDLELNSLQNANFNSILVSANNSSPSIELLKKTNGLDLIKAEAHCKLGSYHAEKGEYKIAEAELQKAGLKLGSMKELVV